MNNIKYVIKRNGSKAPFQVQKLKDENKETKEPVVDASLDFY